MKIPSPGESITEVEIAQWLVESGDYVETDQIIAEIDSDKATLEMPAEAGGRLEWLIEEGDDVEIGAVVAKIDTNYASGGAPAAPKAPAVTQNISSNAPAAKTTYATGHPSPSAAKLMAENNLTDVKGT